MKHKSIFALSSALAVTVALCLPSSHAADTSTNKAQLIEMQMDNDLFLGAEDFFYEFRDVAYIDSITPEAAKTPVPTVADPATPQPASKDRDSSKDKGDDNKPQTETQAAPAGSTTPPPPTVTPPEAPDVPEVPDIPDVPPDCPD